VPPNAVTAHCFEYEFGAESSVNVNVGEVNPVIAAPTTGLVKDTDILRYSSYVVVKIKAFVLL
jgi:hypothetical protein